jgi:hypothetical protein
MTKTYRYRLAGPLIADIAKVTGASVVLNTKDSWTIDYDFDDSKKADVDEYLLERGYEFVMEVP